MSRRVAALLAVVCFTATAGAGARQSLSPHTLLGKVTDASGRALPGATVELMNPASTGSTRTVTTNRDGDYRLEQVVPGLYVLTVRLPGFQPVIRDLEVGGGSELFEYDVQLSPVAPGEPRAPVAANPTIRVICGMTVISLPPGATIDPGIQAPKPPAGARPVRPTIRAVQPTLCWEPSTDATPVRPSR